VEFSKQLNESRIRVLQAREEAVQVLLHEAFARLAALSGDKAAYGRLLTDLLVQVRVCVCGWVGGGGGLIGWGA
jgi:V-type H+-transporting ATPase subunit E